MVSSLGFGSSICDNTPIKTRFRYGSGYYSLNQAAYSLLAQPFYKKYAVIPTNRHSHSYFSAKFQVLFHSPSGVLFTFPSRYLFTIDLQISLALEGGPPCFKPDFSCPTLLRNTLPNIPITATGLLPSVVALSRDRLRFRNIQILRSYNPSINRGLGFSHFARRYSGNL